MCPQHHHSTSFSFKKTVPGKGAALVHGDAVVVVVADDDDCGRGGSSIVLVCFLFLLGTVGNEKDQ